MRCLEEGEGLEVKALDCVPEVVSSSASLPGSIWCRRVGDYACVEVVKFGSIVYPGRPVSRTERTIALIFTIWCGREGEKVKHYRVPVIGEF